MEWYYFVISGDVRYTANYNKHPPSTDDEK